MEGELGKNSIVVGKLILMEVGGLFPKDSSEFCNVFPTVIFCFGRLCVTYVRELQLAQSGVSVPPVVIEILSTFTQDCDKKPEIEKKQTYTS